MRCADARAAVVDWAGLYGAYSFSFPESKETRCAPLGRFCGAGGRGGKRKDGGGIACRVSWCAGFGGEKYGLDGRGAVADVLEDGGGMAEKRRGCWEAGVFEGRNSEPKENDAGSSMTSGIIFFKSPSLELWPCDRQLPCSRVSRPRPAASTGACPAALRTWL